MTEKNVKIIALDDMRDFPQYEAEGVLTICRTIEQAIETLDSHRFDVLLLDHDLGEGYDNNGYYFLKRCFDEGIRLPKIIIIVSSNPVGRENMAGFLQSCWGYHRWTPQYLERRQ